MTVGLLVPAFNEEEKLGAVLDAVPRILGGHGVVVMVIDDGSTDSTARVARDHGATVYQQSQNGGKGTALRRGMRELRTLNLDVVVWMDSDGQHRPQDLDQLTAPILDGRAAMVVGSRYMSRSEAEAPLNRRLVRRLTIQAIRKLTGLTLTDPFSGFRAFSPEAVDAIDLCGDKYESELEALFCVSREGLPIMEIAIERIYGPDTSKMGYHRGRILGRLSVVTGYAKTISSEWAGRTDRVRATVG
jgi:glycosyltransferase involved in cell wall biosynthesis